MILWPTLAIAVVVMGLGWLLLSRSQAPADPWVQFVANLEQQVLLAAGAGRDLTVITRSLEAMVAEFAKVKGANQQSG